MLSLAAVSVVGLGVTACGSDETSSSRVGTDIDGASLYADNCASCHGEDLRGTDLGPSHLSIVYEPSHHGDESFRAAARDGAQQHHWSFGDMPQIAGLDDDEIDAIIAFVRDAQQEQGFEPYPP